MQEALLRLHGARGGREPRGVPHTVTTRLAIDVLRSARVRRETYVGRLAARAAREDERRAARRGRGDVSLAFLVLLERLTPDERAVLVLREAFDYGVRRDRRGRRQVPSQLPPDPQPRPPAHRRGAAALRRRSRASAARSPRASSPPRARATSTGLVAMLAPDAVLVGDGGGKARAIPRPLVGAEAGRPRARRPSRAWPTDWGVTLEPALVNGQPGFRSLAPDGGARQRRRLRRRRRRASSASTRCSTPTSSATSARSPTSGCARRCGNPHRHDACHLQCPPGAAAA